MRQDDLALSGLIHDLNNIFQTLVDSAGQLFEDVRWDALSVAVLRSVCKPTAVTV